MFRNILFIYCIHAVFCYTFIENYSWNFSHFGSRNKSKDTNDKLVFNVADYLKKSHEQFEKNLKEKGYTNDGNYNYENVMDDENYMDDGIESEIQSSIDLDNPSADYEKSDLTKRSIEYFDDAPKNKEEVSIVNPEDICMFKKMKFPFFSHDQHGIRRQKRKRACQKCGMRKSDVRRVLVGFRDKRSYRDLCWKCRDEIIKQLHLKELQPKTIHNSRQYFQELNNQQKCNASKKFIEGIKITVTPTPVKPLKKPLTKSDELDNSDYFTNYDERPKRDDDKERRLKELEETEKKVDKVEIVVYKPPAPVETPHYN